MIIRNFYEPKLAQASYLVGCSATGEAIVVDPMREVQPYLAMAKSLGLRIVAVTETHIHADYLSGTRQLAAATRATMYLSDEGGEDWRYAFQNDPGVVLLHDSDVVRIGNVSLKAIHTPGHTPEHLAFLLVDHPVSAMPHSLFSGDFVFVGDVGRPDLLERAANIAGTMEQGARNLFRSLKKLADLPNSLLVWPGHGAGSACGKSLGGSPVSTLGYERATNWALRISDEDKFVEEILSGQPEPPYYFKEMKRLNKQGPPLLSADPVARRIGSPVGQLIDVRDSDVIRESSYGAAVVVPYESSFTGYAGWMCRYDEPMTLIAECQADADRAARDLSLIGLDEVAGWVHPSDLDPNGFAPFQTLEADEIRRDDLVLDVRGINERNESYIQGSVHIPYGYLANRVGELPRDRRIVVHCASGGRSPIAYSILRRAGFADVWEIPGGMDSVETEAPQLIVSGKP